MQSKNIIVTGASAGIGRELVKIFALQGHTIIAIARREDRLNKLEKEIKSIQSDAKLLCLAIDLSKPESLAWLLKHADSLKRIDVLINNAGILINKAFDQVNRKEFEEVYATNVTAPYFLIQTLLPYLKSSKESPSHIVNISSMGGFQGSAKFPGLSVYSSSKAALANLTECLAEELKGAHIKVNCLALGAVQTEMLQEAFPGYSGGVDVASISAYIAQFALNAYPVINGKIIPVSNSTP